MNVSGVQLGVIHLGWANVSFLALPELLMIVSCVEQWIIPRQSSSFRFLQNLLVAREI